VSNQSCGATYPARHHLDAPSAQDAFLPFLPQDEAGGADPAAEEVVQLIAHDLGQLLAAPDAAFWTTVRGSASLQTCLDSYLQNCRWRSQNGCCFVCAARIRQENDAPVHTASSRCMQPAVTVSLQLSGSRLALP